MNRDTPRTALGRRSLVARLGAVGTALALGARLPGLGGRRHASAQAEPTPAPTWTPPPIPQPLPMPGGTPPPLVGAAPPEPDPPPGSAPTSIENPQQAQGTPGAGTPTSGEFAVSNPQQPPQPLATPVTAEDGPPPAATVTLTPDFRFDPPEVTVRVGEAVEWTNAGRAPQTVTCDPARARDKSRPTVPSGAQPWDSGVLNTGDTFSQTFDVPGEYVYFSMPQEEAGMIGRVVVQP